MHTRPGEGKRHLLAEQGFEPWFLTPALGSFPGQELAVSDQGPGTYRHSQGSLETVETGKIFSAQRRKPRVRGISSLAQSHTAYMRHRGNWPRIFLAPGVGRE